MFKLKFIKARSDKIPTSLKVPIRSGMGKSMTKAKKTAQQKYMSGGASIRSRSGDLKRSLKKRVFSRTSSVSGQLSTSVEYGLYHEYGTRNDYGIEIMKARPFLRPALEDNLLDTARLIEDEIYKYWNKK